MGWVSTLEDIIERIDDGLRDVDRHEIGTVISRDELIKREQGINRLVATCRQIRQQIENYVELATDPSVSLAYELEFQEIYIRDLKSELSKVQRQLRELQVYINGVKFNESTANARITLLEQENSELRNKLVKQEKHEKRTDSKFKKINRSK